MFCKMILGLMKQRLTCTKLMGREKYGGRKERLTIQITPHQVSNMVAVVFRHGHV